jgi:NAD(P)-dependent dehydrogenase (short-subunit alcohol dehydrogenase family)
MVNSVLFGAAGLLGPIWARTLSSCSDRVYLVGLSIDKDASISALVEESPEKYTIVSLDLTNKIQLHNHLALEGIFFKYAVFNAAKDSVPNEIDTVSELANFEWSTWEDFISKNCQILTNALNFFCSHRESKAFGVVIGSLYASVAPRNSNYVDFNGRQAFLKHPGYGASKSAIKAILKQYAANYAEHGLVLNMLSPGIVENNQPEWFKTNILSQIPSRTLIRKEELSSALTFLLSEGCQNVIGHDLLIDGGYSLW